MAVDAFLLMNVTRADPVRLVLPGFADDKDVVPHIWTRSGTARS